MSESILPVKIEHDGIYCDRCALLAESLLTHVRYCKAFKVYLWTCGNLVRRCDDCLKNAVPVTEAEK